MIDITRMLSAFILGLLLCIISFIIKGLVSWGGYEYLLFIPTVVCMIIVFYEYRKV